MVLYQKFTWNFYLLGGLRVEQEGNKIPLPPYRCQRLLVYLLLKLGSSVRRERLIGDLYPDMPPPRARRLVSDHLWLIRSALPGFQIESSGNDVQIAASNVWVDCVAFSQGIRKNNTEAMVASVQLYQGDLAPDLYDDWALVARESFRNQFINALLMLASRFEKLGQHLRSSELLERFLREEPYDEAAVRQLMQAYLRLGRRGLAISTFEKYRQLWIEQLGLEPECETQVLYESILARTTFPNKTPHVENMAESAAGSFIKLAATAFNEGDRTRMLYLLRAAKTIIDPDLALKRELLSIDEAIRWDDAPRARQMLESIDHPSGHVELRRAVMSLAEKNIDIAYPILMGVLKTATTTRDLELEVMALIEIAAVKLLQAEFRDAFLAVDRAIYLLSQVDLPALLARSYFQKGEILNQQGAYQDGREVLFQAQSLAAAHNLNCLLAEINFSIGNSFLRSAAYASAEKIFMQALETARDTGLKKLEAQILLAISAVLDFLGRKGGIQLLTSAHEIYRELNDPVGLAKVNYNLASALPYHDESRCAEAAQYARAALEVFEKAGRPQWQAVAHTALAFALWVDGHHPEALSHYQQSLQMHLALQESFYVAELCAYIGLVYLGMDDLQAALEWTEKAFYEQSMRNHSDIVADIYYARGAAYEASGNTSEAVKLYSRAYDTLLHYAQAIEDEEARHAYFHRDPVTRRLMKKVHELGLSPQPKEIVILRKIGRSKEPFEFSLTVDTGASDQAFALENGAAVLRRARLQRLLLQAERRHTHLSTQELAKALDVSLRTVQRDLLMLKSKRNA